MSTHQQGPDPSRAEQAGENPLEQGEREALLEALGRGLEEALEGVEVLDHALALDEGIAADLAAVDGDGRLLVVLLLEGDPDRAALAALDLTAWVREHAVVLIRHLDSPDLRPDKPARILVVVTEFAEVLKRRLATLEGAGVELFDLRTIQSAAGDRVYLSALETTTLSPLTPSDSIEAFLDALPADLRALGRHAIERIERLDEELVALSGKDSILWRFRGQPLVRLEHSGGRLCALLGADREAKNLLGPGDVLDLLESALARLVPLFSLPYPRSQAGPKRAPRSVARCSRGEPLLSAEEIEAFRD